MKAFEDL